jgi:hypothetical protein
VEQLLVKEQIQTISQPLHSPDLTPWEFWLFPRLKIGLTGYRFSLVK